jgi:outer membrane biogenesis lipoprotein LolB
MNIRLFLLATLLLSPLLLLTGCTGGEAPADNTAMLQENQRVSNVPWNRPEGWEGRSQLGALQNDPRFSGSR